MKASPSNSLWDLKALAIVGVGVFILMFSLPVVLGYVVLLHSATLSGLGNDSSIVLRDDEPLGEKGSRCGGTTHLPCRPGLSCSATKSGEVGTCVEDSGEFETGMQLGDTCISSADEVQDCASGLVCSVDTGDSGTCKIATATDPHVVSVRLEGAHPSAGAYVAEPGTEVKAYIQTVNAKYVIAHLKLEDTDAAKFATVSGGEGGVWIATFKMPDWRFDFDVTAVGQDGKDRSLLVLRIAPSAELR